MCVIIVGYFYTCVVRKQNDISIFSCYHWYKEEKVKGQESSLVEPHF